MPRHSAETAAKEKAAELPPFKLGDTVFYCENRQMEVSTLFCLDSYVDVNALNVRDSQCFKCLQGCRVRNAFAGAL